MLRVERVTQTSDLAPLKDEWDCLVLRSLAPEVYLTHEWVTLWCQHFVQNEELFMLLVWDDTRLVGVAPLMKTRKYLKGVPIQQLGFLLNRCNVRGNLVVAPDRTEECLVAMLEHLQAACHEWDILSLHGMPESSGVPEALEGLSRIGRVGLMPVLPISSWEIAVIHLEGGWEAYLSEKTSNHRKKAKKEMRILESLGGVTFDSYTRPEEVSPYFDEFLGIEAQSWKVKHGESLYEHPAYYEFYAQMTERYAERNAWRAWILRVGNRPMAAVFGLLYNGTFYAEKTTFIAEMEKASPGSAVVRHAIMESFREKIAKEIDLDQHTHFTSRLQTHTHYYHHVEVFNHSPYSLAVYGLKRMLQGARKLWRWRAAVAA